MNINTIKTVAILFTFGLILNSCKESSKKTEEKVVEKVKFASEVIPFFDHWNLILGDGSNAGIANNFENKDYFYTQTDKSGDWVVFKAPNAGDTHGTSNNCRTELAQLKKWSAHNTVYKLWLGQSSLGKSCGFSKASFYQESSMPRHATAHIHKRCEKTLFFSKLPISITRYFQFKLR